MFFFFFIQCTVDKLALIRRARFTKQGKLARERNSKTVPMGMYISLCDLLTTLKLKKTDATSHLHIDQ